MIKQIMQIAKDENDVVTMCSIGGKIDGGIDVTEIPDEVMECPAKYIYNDGEFTENTDFVYNANEYENELTVNDLSLAIAELAEVMLNG